ncbi:hypothetical protein EIZ46_06820 [Chryseobacterium lacus]|nr:hypothetical protein EIZ46_06820 [Chryseobacterium lacus]
MLIKLVLIITWLFSAGRQTHAGRAFFLCFCQAELAEAFIIHFSLLPFTFCLLPFTLFLLPFTFCLFSFLLNN